MDYQPVTPVSQPSSTPKHPQDMLAAVTYIIFFAPNLAGKKDDQFVKYHQRQAIGLVLFALILQGIISIIGYWGGPQYTLAWVVRLILLYFVIIGGKTALAGETKELPFIGPYATRLNLTL